MSLEIRKATAEDSSLILSLIKGIAEFEHLEHEFVATEELLLKNMFGETPYAHCYLAFFDGELAAYSLYFFNFSTFLAKPGLYLEDLYVKPEYRRQGIGKALLLNLAKVAKDHGCGRMEWMALDWNTRAHAFYKELGADMLTEWNLFRTTGISLDKLADLANG